MIFIAISPITYADSKIESSINNDSRPVKDREADTNRKPTQVLKLAGIKPGDKVFDMFAGGGYYTELLSHMVGKDGQVISHNNEAYINYLGESINARYKDGRLPNVKRITSEANDLSFEANSLDAIFMILTIHDFYHSSNFWPAIDTEAVLAMLHKALKPGGTLIVVDHIGPDADITENSQKLHRVFPAHAEKDLLAAGFKFVDKADFLKNPDDPITISMGDPVIRGKTSRFVYKLTK